MIRSLKDYEGCEILARIPQLNTEPGGLSMVLLHKVEDAGIWIESQKLTDCMLDIRGAAMVDRTPIIFFPWAQVLFLKSSRDSVAISTKGLND